MNGLFKQLTESLRTKAECTEVKSLQVKMCLWHQRHMFLTEDAILPEANVLFSKVNMTALPVTYGSRILLTSCEVCCLSGSGFHSLEKLRLCCCTEDRMQVINHPVILHAEHVQIPSFCAHFSAWLVCNCSCFPLTEG